tara:strand:- start:178188 stop:179930 length:1743 start_codon:yes stop_codon:yes gene_type:complete
MFRVFALTISLLLPLAGSGCAVVEIGMRNPVVGLETVAVAPFFNLSQERTVDGREFALDYYAELQKIPGFEVVPVGVTERAMIESGITLSGPNDAVRLAQILNVDAVVVGAVTDYDPYNPRIGLKVAWYSPRQWLFVPTEDSAVSSSLYRSSDEPAKRPGRPKYGTARAQSPDDSDQWVSAEFETSGFRTTRSTAGRAQVFVEEGDWEAIEARKNASQVLLAEAGSFRNQNFATGQSLLPEGTSLLVPAGDDHFPSLPEPEPAREPQPAPPAEEDWSSQTLRVRYQDNVDLSDASPEAAEFVPPLTKSVPAQAVSTQAGNLDPPVAFQPPPSAQPIAPVRPAVEAPQSPVATNEPTPLPGSDAPSRQPVIASPSDNNPFTRHLQDASPPDESRSRAMTSRTGLSDLPRNETPRIAAAEPEFPGPELATPGREPAPTVTMPPTADTSPAEPQPGLPGSVMRTPLFPVPNSEANQWPTPPAQSMQPELSYDDPVNVHLNEVASAEPLMAYVRLFDATDRRLIARLSDYLELTGQLRSGDLEAYMKRSEFFRKFTAHVMISEMLQLHGGEAQRQLVLKPRKYR